MPSPIFAAVVVKNKLVATGTAVNDMPELERLARKAGGTVMRLLGRGGAAAAPIAQPSRQPCCIWAATDGSCHIHDRHRGQWVAANPFAPGLAAVNHHGHVVGCAATKREIQKQMSGWDDPDRKYRDCKIVPATATALAEKSDLYFDSVRGIVVHDSELRDQYGHLLSERHPRANPGVQRNYDDDDDYSDDYDPSWGGDYDPKLRRWVTFEEPEAQSAVQANGVYDPGVLKAVFLAGGPGSGKSYQSEQLFGVPKTSAIVTSSACGLKLVNPDPYFEHYMRQQGIDPKTLGQLSAEDNYRVCEAPDSPRQHAKRVNQAWLKAWLAGRVGLVIDGTGDDLAKITKQKRELEALGYDTFMVFVNTSLPVAQARNTKRARSLAPELVEHIWNEVQKNIGGFQQLFDRGFAVVDASVPGPTPAAVIKAVNRFLREPTRNHIGKAWIAVELAAKDRRGVQANPPKLTPRAEIGPLQLWTAPDGSLWRSSKSGAKKPNGQPEKAFEVCGKRPDNHESVLRDLALQFGGGQQTAVLTAVVATEPVGADNDPFPTQERVILHVTDQEAAEILVKKSKQASTFGNGTLDAQDFLTIANYELGQYGLKIDSDQVRGVERRIRLLIQELQPPNIAPYVGNLAEPSKMQLHAWAAQLNSLNKQALVERDDLEWRRKREVWNEQPPADQAIQNLAMAVESAGGHWGDVCTLAERMGAAPPVHPQESPAAERWTIESPVGGRIGGFVAEPAPAPAPAVPVGLEREVACVFHQLRIGDYFHTGKKIPTRPNEAPTWQIWRKTSKSTADLEESWSGSHRRYDNDGRMTNFGPQNSVWTASLERLRQPPVRPVRKAVEMEAGTPIANRKALLDANRTYIRDVRKAEPLDNWRTKTPQVAVLRYDGCPDARLYSDGFRLYFLAEPQEPFADLFGIYALTYNNATIPHIVWHEDSPTGYTNMAVVTAAREHITTGSRQETVVGPVESAIRIVANTAIDRVQIFFPGRPTQDQLRSLKGSGWHWSPRNNCWMRKLTAAAINSADNIVAGYGKHPSTCQCEDCMRAKAARMEDFRWR